MSSNKRGLLMRTLLTSNYAGCGCSKPKPSEVHQPTPIPKISLNCHNTTTTNLNPTTTTASLTSSSTSTGACNDDEDEDLLTSTTVSETDTAATTTTHQDHNKKGNTSCENDASNFLLKPSPKIVDDSVAVEKESKDPYRDFRYSMLQMIFEKEIFSESGLQELLQCFLELNAPCHHHVIVQVFMEICQETFPNKSCSHDSDNDGGGESSSCRSEPGRARN